MKGTSHYSFALLPKELNAWAREKAVDIHRWGCHGAEQVRSPVFCFTGISGIALTTALSCQLDSQFPDFKFGMLCVRKPGEKSHGALIERGGMEGLREPTLMFVDDHATHGRTFLRVREVVADVGRIRHACLATEQWRAGSQTTLLGLDSELAFI